MQKYKTGDRLDFRIPDPKTRNFWCNQVPFLWLSVLVGLASCFPIGALTYSIPSDLELGGKLNTRDPVCSKNPDAGKFDCHADLGASGDSCTKRGCCFQPESKHSNLSSLHVPWCFFPSDYKGYVFEKVLQDGKEIRATLRRSIPSGFPDDIQNLNLVITFLDDFTLRLKNKLQSKVVKNGYPDKMLLGQINMVGLKTKPTKITVNGVNCKVIPNSEKSVLIEENNFESMPIIENTDIFTNAMYA